MDKLTILLIGLDIAGMTVCPAVSDANDGIGRKQARIAVTVRRLKTAHARHQTVVVRNNTPTHQGWDDRNAGDFSKFDQKIGSIGIDDAAASNDQRALRFVEHGNRLFCLCPRCCWLISFHRLIGIDVKLDFSELDIDRQIDQHRSGTTRLHNMKCLLENKRHQCWLHNRNRPFGNGSCDLGNIDCLEVLFVEACAGCLACNAEDWN